MTTPVEELRALMGMVPSSGAASDPVAELRGLMGVQSGSAQPRPQPRPNDLRRPDPRVAEREQMRTNALPPGTNPETIPQPSPAIDPAAMPAIDVRRRPGMEDGTDVIKVTENGGYVYRHPDGSLSYSDDVATIRDQGRVMDILRGATGGEAYRRGYSEDIVAQNPVASRAATAIEGVPFVGSYGDEVAGLVGGPEAQQAWLASTNAMRDANPGQAAALSAAGTVGGAGVLAYGATPFLPQVATRGGQVLRNTVLGALGGATEGAVYGYGQQQGEGRTSNALTQGLVGGGLGVASGLAVAALDRRILGQAERLRGQSVDVLQEQLGVSPQAAQMIREALSAGELDRAISTLERRGPQAMMAEASPALRQLLNVVTKTDIGAGNIASNAVSREVGERYGRLTGVLDDVLGSPQGVREVQEGVMDATRGARSSSYSNAFSAPIDYASEVGQDLEGILQRRLPRGVIERANEALREADEVSPQIMARIADDGTVSFERPLSVQQIDYIARELQTMEGAARRATGRTADALRYGDLRRDIRDRLRTLVPAYGDALDAGADALGQREAVTLGSRALRMNRSELRFELRNLNSDAERSMVAQGLRENIDDLMARAGAIASDPDVDAREIRRILQPMTSREGLENIEAVVGNEGARAIREAVEVARDGLELRAAISRNSDTAISQAAQGRMRELTPGDLFDAVGQMDVGQARRSIVHALSGDSAEAQQLRMGGLAQEIASVLTSQTGDAAQRALRIVNEYVSNPAAMPDREALFVARVVSRAGVLSAYQQGRLSLAPPQRGPQ
jgi:hypothetical protein